MKNATLVLGASLKPTRYANIAIKRLRAKEIETYAIGLQKGSVADVVIDVDKKDYKNIDTVTLYLNTQRQKDYYNYILSLHPRRVIFNPGTENFEFSKLLESKGIKPVVACTLVLLSINQY